MKVESFVYLLFCVILCFMGGCSPMNSSALGTGEMNKSSQIQSEITTSIGDEQMDNNCKLIVNGKDITAGNYVKLNQDYADLPFTAVMEALGAEVQWQNKTTAKMTFENKDYVLDTTICSLVEVGKTFNIILPPPGGTRHYQVVGDEFVLDRDTTQGALQLMGTKIRITIDWSDKIINIDNMRE